MGAESAAGNATAAAAASTTTAGSSTGSNLGKYFMVAQGLSALMGVASGFSGMGAANSEAESMNAQAELALQESQASAQQKREQVLAFREEQAQGYNNSGVLLEGSPMTVLSDTVRKGNQEIDAIMKRGQAMSDLYRAKAKQTGNAGKAGALGSVFSAGAGLASAWILGKKIGIFGNGGGTTNPPITVPKHTGAGDYTPYTGGIA